MESTIIDTEVQGKKATTTSAPKTVEEAMSKDVLKAPRITTEALQNEGDVAPVFITT